MRAHEFLREEASAGAMSAGSVAPVAQALGSVQIRALPTKSAKYRNSAPVMKRKQHASR